MSLPPMTPAQRRAYDQAVDQFFNDLLRIVRHIVEHEHDPDASVFDTDMEGGWETVASAGRLETLVASPPGFEPGFQP